MTLLTDLDPGLIPHRRWAMREWWCADPLWYYHRPRRAGRLVAGRQFYQHVDPPLRPLCRLLHAAGLKTTPSCAGHFHPREHFEAIWQALARQADQVRCGGLTVADPETGRNALFANPRHRLPWPTRNHFIARAMAHQGTGYLGVIAPGEAPWLGDLGQLEGVQVRHEDGLFAILVRTSGEPEQWRAWTQIALQFQRILSDGCFPPQELPAFPL